VQYFSDMEKGLKDRVTDEISKEVHEGIVEIYKKYVNKKSFFESSGNACPCGQSIYVFNERGFLNLAKVEIPDFQLEYLSVVVAPFLDDYIQPEYNKYKILDFIQFCYKNLKKAKLLKGSKCTDPFLDDSPEFYHYIFEDCDSLKESFKNDINTIFERNGIVFELKETGEIERTVPLGLLPLVSKLYTTKDIELNTLVEDAFKKFTKPEFSERKIALEKIWDAFERMKTYYKEKDKNKSIEELIKQVSSNNEPYKELLTTEAFALGKIGNGSRDKSNTGFSIRHYETNKHAIINDNQIDYLFYRMVSFMALFLKYLEKNK